MNISVIIPVYNMESFLERAVVSVLEQSEVVELLLIDDGSTDGSLQKCYKMAERDLRITVLRHPGGRNRGVSASRNLGIINARCPFISFLDADDYYLPNRFWDTTKCFNNYENIDGVYEMTGLCLENSDIRPFTDIQLVTPTELFESLQPIGDKVWFHIDGLTVKKTIFDKCGYFDTSLKTSEDTLQWFKMAATSKLLSGSTTKPVAISEKVSTGLSANQKNVQKDFILMLLKLCEFCKKMDCKDSRKEIVLNSLFFYISVFPYNELYQGIDRLKLFLKVVVADPTYALIKSSVFRRYFGNLIGYNRIRHFFAVR